MNSNQKEVQKQELEKLYKQYGRIDSRIVLEAARDPEHPLHKYFEWDDRIAGEKYRLEQAYRMILASKIVVELRESAQTPAVHIGHRPEVRQMVNAFRGQGFVMRHTVLSDAVKRAAFVAHKRKELNAWAMSVADMREFDRIRDLVLIELEQK